MNSHEHQVLKKLQTRIQLLLSTQNRASDELSKAAKQIPEDSDAYGTVGAIAEDLDAALSLLWNEIEELDDFLRTYRPIENEAA